MQRIWYARDSIEAAEVVDRLCEAGFDARVLGEGLAAAAGALPTTVVGPEVFIGDAESRSAALAVIEQWMRQGGQRPLFPATCVHCGYDLRGCVDPRCPECGYEYRPVPEAWLCAGCGESIEGHFTACWRCGQSAPAAPGVVGAVGAAVPDDGETAGVQGEIVQSANSSRRHEPLTVPERKFPLWFWVVPILMLVIAICAR